MGIVKHITSLVKNIIFDADAHPSWVGYRIGGVDPFSIILLYAKGSTIDRTNLWHSMRTVQSSHFRGHFNMVEKLEDRQNKLEMLI